MAAKHLREKPLIMNSVIENIYKTGKVEDVQGFSIAAFPTSIKYNEGMALYNIIKKTKAKRTLETGMAYGLSTLFICQAHHENGGGHHIAVDPCQKTIWQSIGLLNIKRAGLEKYLKFYDASSHEALPRLLSDKERFDLIFIDGSHLFDYALLDFFYADKLLVPGGRIILHDLWMPSVRKVLSFILKNKNYGLGSEFIWERYPLWKRLLRSVRDITQTPLDLYSIAFTKYRLIDGLPNYCVIKKLSEEAGSEKIHKSF